MEYLLLIGYSFLFFLELWLLFFLFGNINIWLLHHTFNIFQILTSWSLVHSFAWSPLTSTPIWTGFLVIGLWLSCATFVFPELLNSLFFSCAFILYLSFWFYPFHGVLYVLSQSPLFFYFSFGWLFSRHDSQLILGLTV